MRELAGDDGGVVLHGPDFIRLDEHGREPVGSHDLAGSGEIRACPRIPPVGIARHKRHEVRSVVFGNPRRRRLRHEPLQGGVEGVLRAAVGRNVVQARDEIKGGQVRRRSAGEPLHRLPVFRISADLLECALDNCIPLGVGPAPAHVALQVVLRQLRIDRGRHGLASKGPDGRHPWRGRAGGYTQREQGDGEQGVSPPPDPSRRSRPKLHPCDDSGEAEKSTQWASILLRPRGQGGRPGLER